MPSKNPDTYVPKDGEILFAVTVETEIGVVRQDMYGDFVQTPTEAALMIIAEHGKNTATDDTEYTYAFPGPHEGTTTRVRVNWSAPDA